MLNLKLFTALQGNNTANLMLRPVRPGILRYYLVSFSINHSIIVSGDCKGELPSADAKSFDIVLTSIAPLLDRGYNFSITYLADTLQFVEEKERFNMTPLCVEHTDSHVTNIVKKYLDFETTLADNFEISSRLQEASTELLQARDGYNRLASIEPSGLPPALPWGEYVKPSEDAIEKYKAKITALEWQVKTLEEKRPKVEELDFTAFRRIANIASKYNTVISMCGDYSVVALKSSFVLCKASCGIRAVQGRLLQRLLQEKSGVFYELDDEVVFRTISDNDSDSSETVVFMHAFAPNASVDSSIITKGVTLEKYTFNLKEVLPIISVLTSKFKQMYFDLGRAMVVMTNDQGEEFTHKFNVVDANTVALNRQLRTGVVSDITMSTINIPLDIQRIFNFFRDDFVIYVKARKVILQSGNLYAVFAR